LIASTPGAALNGWDHAATSPIGNEARIAMAKKK
jgi:hypothetical protein